MFENQKGKEPQSSPVGAVECVENRSETRRCAVFRGGAGVDGRVGKLGASWGRPTVREAIAVEDPFSRTCDPRVDRRSSTEFSTGPRAAGAFRGVAHTPRIALQVVVPTDDPRDRSGPFEADFHRPRGTFPQVFHRSVRPSHFCSPSRIRPAGRHLRPLSTGQAVGGACCRKVALAIPTEAE